MSLQSAAETRLMYNDRACSSTIVFPVCTNPLLRLGLENVLSEAGFIVWHDIVDGFSSLPRIDDEVSALFIIDGSSFADGVTDLARRLKAHAPDARMVMLADSFDAAVVHAAWSAGVHGFCLTNQRQDVLIKSLELVMLGEIVLPAAIVLPIAELGLSDAEGDAGEGLVPMRVNGHQSRKLSSREAQILACLRDGAPNKVIARQLNLSEATVKVHVKAILKKIGACNRTQAALWAARYVRTEPKPLPSV
ncbi:response regulator transcription factor [Microvirga sesbaniae]|uniref:response regulator transcription factor n=1 Tax=Microvirga sesbaniae TaxID=681392 RepID=UPI0021C954E9|nr:response regulator transcription factor [Microvirga sp. HBU67692]